MLVLLFEVWNDFRAAYFQIRDVSIAVERYPSFPNTKEYSDPAASYLSDRGVMLHAVVTKHVVSGLAPGAVPSSPVGKFVEGLPKKLGAGKSPLDQTLCTASTCHGRDPAECGQAVGIFPAVPLRTKRAE